MTLAELAVMLARIITGQATIQQILRELLANKGNQAIEHANYAIETIAANGTNTVNHPTWGNHAILTAIQGLTPVTLPVTPPAGYGGPSESDVATAVWEYMISQQNPDGYDLNAQAAEWLYTIAHSHAIYSMTEGVPDSEQPYYRLVFGGLSTQYSIGYHPTITIQTRPDPPDWSLLRAGDTVLSFLQRNQPGYWTGTGPTMIAGDGSIAWHNLYGAPTGAWWRSGFQLPIQLPALSPPVWPGLDSVTLGTPVALAHGLTITEPMHGVVVAISAVDPKQMYYTYDDIRAYRHIGALAFVDDNGDAEGWQSLGFVSAVYCCRSMAQAAAVKIMSANGTVGTVTPWTRTA